MKSVKQTCIVLHVAELVLHFILHGNVFPRRQENSLVHFAVLSKQNVHRYDAAEVEHVNIVLDSHL